MAAAFQQGGNNEHSGEEIFCGARACTTESLDAEAERIAASYGASANASLSEARLMLSYLLVEDVDAYYSEVAQLVHEFGDLADLSVAEARDLCQTPSYLRSRGAVIRGFLELVVATVDRFGRSSAASAREVKAISRYMKADEINSYYALVERLSSSHSCHPQDVKRMISTMGAAAAEAHLEMGGHRGECTDIGPALARRAALEKLGFDPSKAAPTPADVLRQYRALARVWHPDKIRGVGAIAATDVTQSGCADLASRFREIKAAVYFLLSGSCPSELHRRGPAAN